MFILQPDRERVVVGTVLNAQGNLPGISQYCKLRKFHLQVSIANLHWVSWSAAVHVLGRPRISLQFQVQALAPRLFHLSLCIISCRIEAL